MARQSTLLDEPMTTELAPINNSPLALFERAITAGHDLGEIEKWMDLQERFDKARAQEAYSKAMAECQAEMPTIKRDAFNKQTKSFYAKLESINAKIVPIYTKHGFALEYDTDVSVVPGYIRTVCDVTHKHGHSKRFHLDLPIDDKGMQGTVNKTPMHGMASTISYSRRYLENLIFNLTIEGEDNDGNAPVGFITDEQIGKINDLMTKIGTVNIDKFLGWASDTCGVAIDSLDQMPANFFGTAISDLNSTLAKKQGRR